MFNHFQDSFGFQSISVGLTDLAAAQGLPQYFHLKLAKVSFTFMLQSVREVLVSIHTKFELSRCLVCPTIEINICSILLIKKPSNQASNVTFPNVEESLLTTGVL